MLETLGFTRRSAALWAAGITFLQILFTFALSSPAPDWAGKFDQLVRWDADRYVDIAENGYRVPPGPVITSDDIHAGATNAVFFPGYPLVARAVKSILGVSINTALITVGYFCCWLFWLYFILLMRLHRVDDRTVAWTCFLVALHPAAFYLVTPYTEPLFCAALLGFIYWVDRWHLATQGKKRGAWGKAALAIGHAAVMSLTRIVSFAMVPYPVFRFGFLSGKPLSLKVSKKAVFVGLFCTVGAIAFFAYCHFRFGEWNLYFRLEEIGWRNHRKWFAVINPLSYVPRFFFEHTVESFNRAAMPLMAVVFYLAWKFERESATTRNRVGMYFSAFVLFYIPLTGKANANMDSMIRYVLPPFALMAICLAQLQSERLTSGKCPIFAGRWKAALVIGSVVSFVVQGWFIYRFLRDKWVA